MGLVDSSPEHLGRVLRTCKSLPKSGGSILRKLKFFVTCWKNIGAYGARLWANARNFCRHSNFICPCSDCRHFNPSNVDIFRLWENKWKSLTSIRVENGFEVISNIFFIFKFWQFRHFTPKISINFDISQKRLTPSERARRIHVIWYIICIGPNWNFCVNVDNFFKFLNFDHFDTSYP
jgi:hypothetical protein